MNKIIFFFLVVLGSLSAQTFSREEFIKQFVENLINDPSKIVSYTDTLALKRAQRFDISYSDVTAKFLSGFEIPLSTRKNIKNGSTEILHNIENLPQDFYRVEVKIPATGYRNYFYFQKDKLVAPSKYLTLYWTKRETKYFDFYVRDAKHFNSYSGFQLEKILNGMMNLLEFTDKEKAELEKNRIIYIIGLNEKNIGEFNGIESKSAFLPAFDEILTTTPYNLSGLADFLIRFKLKKMNLTTPLLFGEGFTAALGGLSPRLPGLIVKLGVFIAKEGILDLPQIADDSLFITQDRSFAIPLAGAYNYFLLNKLGIKEYLRIYLQKNSPNEKALRSESITLKIPFLDEFKQFVNDYKYHKRIFVEDIKDTLPMIFDGEMVRVFDAGDYYYFHCKGSFALSEVPGINDFSSKLFKELVPTRSYEGEKYLISVTREDVIIYNLYNGTVIDAHYQFIDKKQVAGVSNFFRFRVRKDLFKEKFNDLKVVQFY
jgi:hypothetical protein